MTTIDGASVVCRLSATALAVGSWPMLSAANPACALPAPCRAAATVARSPAELENCNDDAVVSELAAKRCRKAESVRVFLAFGAAAT